MTAPLAVVVGFVGKLPLAGMALANLHTMAGLEDLGYRLHYVERQNGPRNLYDPRTSTMTDDPEAALAFLADVFPRYGIDASRYSFIDADSRCHGSGWPALNAALAHADFVLDMGDASWFDELEQCPRRGFIDVDPMFTQVQMLTQGRKASSAARYDTAFTHGVRIGQPDCTMPSAGRRWIPARTAVATRFWRPDTAGCHGRLTTLMNWSSGREIEYDGRSYGYKNREFARFIDLPRHTTWPCAVAMGGAAPRAELEAAGWQLESALAATRSISEYQSFIADSAADFGVVKHAYVESRCGWFSDRSTCYMAAGRPVLHQDTGLADWLPIGEGVLAFTTVADAVEGLKAIAMDYAAHSRRARAIAEEHFEASTVLRQMIRDAGWD